MVNVKMAQGIQELFVHNRFYKFMYLQNFMNVFSIMPFVLIT